MDPKLEELLSETSEKFKEHAIKFYELGKEIELSEDPSIYEQSFIQIGSLILQHYLLKNPPKLPEEPNVRVTSETNIDLSNLAKWVKATFKTVNAAYKFIFTNMTYDDIGEKYGDHKKLMCSFAIGSGKDLDEYERSLSHSKWIM